MKRQLILNCKETRGSEECYPNSGTEVNSAIIGTVTGNYLENPGKFKRYGIEVLLTKEVGDKLQEIYEMSPTYETSETIQLPTKWMGETSSWMFRGHLHQNDCYEAEEIARATKVGMDHTGLGYPFLYDGREVHKMEMDEGLPGMKPVSLRRGMKVMLLITPYTYAIKSLSKKGIAIRVPSIVVVEDAVHITKLNRQPLTPSGRRTLKRTGEKEESRTQTKRGRKDGE